MGINSEARALLFDVFGTCVDWRTTVTFALAEASLASLKNVNTLMTGASRTRARQMSLDDWEAFAAEWRASYYVYTRSVAADPGLRWKIVDDHHLESLQELLVENDFLPGNGRKGLWTNEEIHDMSRIWHRLEPWADTVAGLEALNTKFETCTLSNGNVSLLEDMQRHGGMPFKHTFSSELFNSYKPNPAIYLGAAKKLGLEPGQCVMVAAHLGDLEAAKKCGFQTIYVQREQEEKLEVEKSAKEKEFVDLWIDLGEEGFITAARELGSASHWQSKPSRSHNPILPRHRYEPYPFLRGRLSPAIIDWLRLIRGCHHIILRGRQWLEQGPVSALLPREAWYRTFEAIDERGRKEDYYLASLEQLWTPDTPAQVMTYEIDELEAYQDALVKLRQAFTRMNVAVDSQSHEKECVWCSSGAETPGDLDNRPSRVGAGVCWPMVISDKFFDLLEKRKPVALVLLAHNATLIRRSSDAWWNGAPSMKTVSAVTATLPQEYHVWIEWPQREVGYTSHHRNSDAFMPSHIGY